MYLHVIFANGSRRSEQFFMACIAYSPRDGIFVHAENSIILDTSRSLHSEPNAIQKMHRRGIFSGIRLLVFRFSTNDCREYVKTGKTPTGKLARPCAACTSFLRSAGVVDIFHTNESGRYERHRETHIRMSSGDRRR